MKRGIFLIFIVFLMTPVFSLGISDATAEAAEVLDQAEGLLATIDQMVATGDLDRRVADLAHEVIGSFSNELIRVIQEGGGSIFAGINGSVNNVFYNVKSLLQQVNSSIIGGTLEELLYDIDDIMSSHVQGNLNSPLIPQLG